jgi:hypothetical protein
MILIEAVRGTELLKEYRRRLLWKSRFYEKRK